MKPPKMVGLLSYFDCRQVDPLSVSRALGFTTDPITGQQVDLGHDPYVTIVSLLNRPYSIVPVEGDLRRDFVEFGDRLRDARYLWLSAGLVLTPGHDASTADPAGQCNGDKVRRDLTGETYEVVALPPEHGAVAGMSGYLLLREQT
jgi:hypothetical protein